MVSLMALSISSVKPPSLAFIPILPTMVAMILL